MCIMRKMKHPWASVSPCFEAFSGRLGTCPPKTHRDTVIAAQLR